jgi:hypothetical protein
MPAGKGGQGKGTESDALVEVFGAGFVNNASKRLFFYMVEK